MNILPIDVQETKPTFNASINGEVWHQYTNYLKMYKNSKRHHNTAEELRLTKRIKQAIKEHPSDAMLQFSTINEKGGLFHSGTVKTEYDEIIDIEPARDDSVTAPIENLLRKLLNPENKDLFNKLMGVKYENTYDKWWNHHIRPIWSDIVETFREETVKASENHPAWDEQMNIEFRNRNIEIMEPEPPKQRKGSTLREFIKRMLRIK